MDTPHTKDQYNTSGISNDDIIIHHDQHEYYSPYYCCDNGKSFVQVCIEMGLTSNNNIIIKF